MMTAGVELSGSRAVTLDDVTTLSAARASSTGPAAAIRTRYQARPGRRAVVATRLDELTGAVHGSVELPLRLFWFPDRGFDLDEPGMLAWVYQTVLREAASADDLAYLNGERLVAVWPELFLPRGVRQAWEEQHPVLRAASAAAA
jgi:hypothetical protein